MDETAPDMLGRFPHLGKRELEGGLSTRHLKTTFYGLSETVSNFNELIAASEATRNRYRN
jgi:hypothetical protein